MRAFPAAFRSVAVLAPLAALVPACGIGTGPGEGSIAVAITAHAVPENAAFTLTLNGRDPRLVESAGRVLYDPVAPGTHLVHLFGLPQGCRVQGENPRAVQVFESGTVSVGFSVVCGPEESGGFRIEVTSRGEPLDDDGYQLAVAGAPLRVIEIDAVETYVGLATGMHLVTLKDVIPECRVEGGNPQPFTVVPGETVEIRLAVTCGPPPGRH